MGAGWLGVVGIWGCLLVDQQITCLRGSEHHNCVVFQPLPSLPALLRRLAEAEAELKAGRDEATRRVAAAEGAAAEARRRLETLAEEAQNLRDAVK